MLLEKLEQNRQAITRIGDRAIMRGRELRVTPSCADLDDHDRTDFEYKAAVGDDEPPAKDT